MKTATLFKANDLHSRIEDIKFAIVKIETNDKGCSGNAINLSLNAEDMGDIKKSILSQLKAKQAKYQKEFNNLK